MNDALKEVTMDKNIIKETMLSLEGAALQSAREKYLDYVADARLDRSEPIESRGSRRWPRFSKQSKERGSARPWNLTDGSS
jgi:hypothetical protein